MAKYRKKPIVIEAVEWRAVDQNIDGSYYLSVRFFRDPSVSSSEKCKYCNHTMHYHGWIETLEGGHIVCPRDMVITGIKGEKYPCKPDIFQATYDLMEE